MGLSDVAGELYGLPLSEFTVARDARAAEARKAGDRQLADSVKRLRKPSSGAWIANILVREQPREIDRLIARGTNLRSTRKLDGARIRQATKDKAEMVAKLLRQARSIATRMGLPLSKSIEQELEATLDAAFSDTDSAESLRGGCLTAALDYSGLGFGADAEPLDSAGNAAAPARTKRRPTGTETDKAKQNLELARSEAAEAVSDVEKAQRAVKTAEVDLQRQQAALTVAQRRATRANEKASNAQKNLDLLRGRSRRS